MTHFWITIYQLGWKSDPEKVEDALKSKSLVRWMAAAIVSPNKAVVQTFSFYLKSQRLSNKYRDISQCECIRIFIGSFAEGNKFVSMHVLISSLSAEANKSFFLWEAVRTCSCLVHIKSVTFVHFGRFSGHQIRTSTAPKKQNARELERGEKLVKQSVRNKWRHPICCHHAGFMSFVIFLYGNLERKVNKHATRH